MRERDELRQNNPTDSKLQDLNREIENLINIHKRENWRETVEQKKSDNTKLYN